jgi:hypothetical protein
VVHFGRKIIGIGSFAVRNTGGGVGSIFGIIREWRGCDRESLCSTKKTLVKRAACNAVGEF